MKLQSVRPGEEESAAQDRKSGCQSLRLQQERDEGVIGFLATVRGTLRLWSPWPSSYSGHLGVEHASLQKRCSGLDLFCLLGDQATATAPVAANVAGLTGRDLGVGRDTTENRRVASLRGVFWQGVWNLIQSCSTPPCIKGPRAQDKERAWFGIRGFSGLDSVEFHGWVTVFRIPGLQNRCCSVGVGNEDVSDMDMEIEKLLVTVNRLDGFPTGLLLPLQLLALWLPFLVLLLLLLLEFLLLLLLPLNPKPLNPKP